MFHYVEDTKIGNFILSSFSTLLGVKKDDGRNVCGGVVGKTYRVALCFVQERVGKIDWIKDKCISKSDEEEKKKWTKWM